MQVPINVAAPQLSGPLTLFPLLLNERIDHEYICGPEAEALGVIEIREVGDDPRVPELAVENRAEQPVLLIEGETLVGLRQNRTLNLSVLCASGVTTIPVSCVEAGRWGLPTLAARSTRHAPSGLRSRKSASVVAAMSRGHGRSADQGQVWTDVDAYGHRTGVRSATHALEDTYATIEPDADALLNAVMPLDGQVGVIAAVGGHVISLDLFDKDSALRSYWRGLTAGYALEAVGQPDVTASLEDAAAFAAAVSQTEMLGAPATGLGDELRFESPDVVGLGLAWDGRIVHLAAFKKESDPKVSAVVRATRHITFRSRADEAALRWKEHTALLPAEARQPGRYFRDSKAVGPELPLCLPVEFAALNLLPEARAVALDRFERDHIRWHEQTPAGPSNHLLDSQVQCVNALAPLITESDAIRHVFASALDIEEVLPFEPDTQDFLVFEWIGLVDHLGEGSGKPRTRGARTTSSDAAFRYRTSGGSTEIALCEWKYTETYDGHALAGGERAMKVRRRRYHRWWQDPQGPVTTAIPYEDLFVEPFYQRFRQQLLAYEMERTHELGSDRVRVVHLAPEANTELWSSLTRPSHRAAGADLGTAWNAVLRYPDRFLTIDPETAFRHVVSDDFRDRYGWH
jgi:ARG/rhodanese/phosphatase superfamily protein/restriction endonuclease-like protein